MAPGSSIAVIGSGISGLGAAWLLSQGHRVTLLERAARAGGHSNTVDVADGARSVAVDTGFIVYNTQSYPNLIQLFDHLGVPTAPTSMSFAVSLDEGGYEYSGTGLAGVFGQRRNLLSPSHWRMLLDMLRFFREARALLADSGEADLSLGDFLARRGYCEAFIARHILPMAAAIWSTPSADVMRFPVAAFARFFDNHGLLQAYNQPQWRTVVGGSREYVGRVVASMAGRVELGCAARMVQRRAAGVTIVTDQGTREFDACVMATHADEALSLLADPDPRERELLGAFRYALNRAVLHDDASLMPRRRHLWSSWNYIGEGTGRHSALSLTYWMNNLQPLGVGTRDLFVTLNPWRPLRPGAELAAFDYRHPMFDAAAMQAQRRLWSLQGRRHTWFCGSYFGYGFHEDGLQAGLAAAEHIGGVRRPWAVAGESGRIHIGGEGSAGTAPALEAAE